MSSDPLSVVTEDLGANSSVIPSPSQDIPSFESSSPQLNKLEIARAKAMAESKKRRERETAPPSTSDPNEFDPMASPASKRPRIVVLKKAPNQESDENPLASHVVPPNVNPASLIPVEPIEKITNSDPSIIWKYASIENQTATILHSFPKSPKQKKSEPNKSLNQNQNLSNNNNNNNRNRKPQPRNQGRNGHSSGGRNNSARHNNNNNINRRDRDRDHDRERERERDRDRDRDRGRDYDRDGRSSRR